MRRRDILAGAGSLAAGASVSFPAPAIAQGIRQLKMVTDWPEDMPGLQTSARRFAQTDRRRDRRPHQDRGFSGRRVRARVRDLRRGRGRVSPTCITRLEGYFEKKSRAFNFFCGRTLRLYRKRTVRMGPAMAAAKSCGTRSAVNSTSSRSSCTSTGCQMGGWFTREITSPDGFRGLRYRMPGLGAEVLRRLGAIVVTLPGGEIVPALKSGAIDASEWIGPWLDMAIGLHKAAGYYYYPGFHEPGSGFSVGINKRVWESFDASDRQADRGRGRRRIRALAGGVQRQQRAVAAQAAGRRHRQDPEIRRFAC